MRNTYNVKVLADSISPDDVRLTTLEVTFPRFILAEVNTHRMLSRNSASSRAIPTEKMIDRVRESPFIPETFNKRVKGMGVGEEHDEKTTNACRAVWEEAARHACACAEMLNNLGLDKSRANRLLEPFLWHTAIISATEWDNFFGLRDHPAAQPEFQIVAKMMKEAMFMSQPQPLSYGWWHLPMLAPDELAALCAAREQGHLEVVEDWKLISAGRCARVSYDTHKNSETLEKSIERAKILKGNGHFSPFEHVARPVDDHGVGPHHDYAQWGPEWTEFVGNFRGWVQMRKEIQHEDRFDLALKAQA